MATVQLSTKSVGSIVKLAENGKNAEFYVARHNYFNGLNGNGRTLLVRKECYEKREWRNVNATAVTEYNGSGIDNWLNGTYFNLLDKDIKSAIGTTKIKYTAYGGNNVVSTISKAVFLLSSTELGGSNGNSEGTKLSIASTLKKATYNGSACKQWTRSSIPYSNGTEVLGFDSGGYELYTQVSDTDVGARPAFTLPGTIGVADDGVIVTNTAPTIASESGVSGVSLGVKSGKFSFTYTPSDVDGDTLTITEKLDGVAKKTRTNVASGTKLTFECASTDDGFLRITNGLHTIAIDVYDGTDTTTFTATFTKKVTRSVIQLKAPLAVDGLISVAILSVTGSIPEDAEYKVEVTNNGNDDNPVWQDVTKEVKNGTNIVFENKKCNNGAAFNFRITAAEGTSGIGGYITAVSGAFQ